MLKSYKHIQIILLLIIIQNFIFAQSGNGHPVDDQTSTSEMLSMIFVFMLATFIGLGVITRVSRLLHTPLMSLTNAISAIAVVGSIILTGHDYPPYITILGAIALFASMTNIVSGFMITQRMLKMFRVKPEKGTKPSIPLKEGGKS